MTALSDTEILSRLKKSVDLSGSLDLDDLLLRHAKGTVLCAHNEGGVGFAEVLDGPHGRALNVLVAGGRLPDLMRIYPQVEEAAHAHDCVCVTVSGRLAWQRVLAPMGFRPVCITLKKDL